MFFPHCASSGSPWPATIPRISGRPVEIEFRTSIPDGSGGEAHAATDLRQRRMAIEEALMAHPEEFARIFVHELFHFAWLRLGNAKRRSYEQVVARELRRHVSGELGWSAEWRKSELTPRDRRERTRKWREYCCESFCDTAAWLYAGVRKHAEFTLVATEREGRREWFRKSGLNEGVAI